MGLKRKTSLLASALMLSANFLMPASTFAAGAGTGGLSFYDYLAANADKDTVIDFNQAPATGNVVDETTGAVMSDIGGLYMLQDTKNDEKPMYFYRGNVTDNNVILNNFCWLMVRTTETGGTKLLYNGKPNETGACLGDSETDWNTIQSYDEVNTVIGVSPFNEQYSSPADFGYMYGDRYEATDKSFTSSTVFGNDVTYSNGTYTLQDTVTGGSAAYNAHHYTCLSTSTTCSEVYYENNRPSASSTYSYFLTFTDGDTLETALAKMAENKNDSTIKTFIENWYTENMTDATNLLEDTIWYGGKTFGSGSLSTKDSDFGSNFDARGYSYTDTMLDIYYHGASRAEDNLSDSGMVNAVNFDYTDENGIYTVANGTLKYPVGMLTNSEMIMAGNGSPAFAKNTYIDSGPFLWWGLSPFDFGSYSAVAGYFYGLYGSSDGYGVDRGVGVRPSVSLKSTLGALDGDGSRENPFTALAEVTESEDEEAPAEGETTPVNPQTSDYLYLILPLLLTSIIAITSSRKLITRGRK